MSATWLRVTRARAIPSRRPPRVFIHGSYNEPKLSMALCTGIASACFVAARLVRCSDARRTRRGQVTPASWSALSPGTHPVRAVEVGELLIVGGRADRPAAGAVAGRHAMRSSEGDRLKSAGLHDGTESIRSSCPSTDTPGRVAASTLSRISVMTIRNVPPGFQGD
jgi:hypothetical protein